MKKLQAMFCLLVLSVVSSCGSKDDGSACESYCSYASRCGGVEVDPCIADCEISLGAESGACRRALVDYYDCVGSHSCDSIMEENACDDRVQAVDDSC